MKKNIALIYLGRKGAGASYSLEMANALLNSDNKLLCVISTSIENLACWEELESRNSNLSLLQVETYTNKFQFLKSLANLRQHKKIAKQIVYFKPNFIYIPMLALLASLIIKHIHNIPIITTVHDVTPHLGEANRLVQKLDNMAIKHSTKIVVLSKIFEKQIVDRYGFSSDNVFCIPHANFAYYRFNQIPEFNTIHHRIIFFGRIVQYKGLEVLLKAFKLVLSEIPFLRLMIAGNGELSIAELKLIEELKPNIDLQIRWISDDEVAGLFSKVDLSIIPYIEASQSGVIPLSYSMGKGVIASDVGGLREQLYPGTGIILSPNDESAIAQSIISCYRDEQKIIEMNREAYRISITELSWEKSAEILLKNATC